MAVCVFGPVLDTDADPPELMVACQVHCHYAPCPLNGAPASTVPLEAVDGDHGGRPAALARWALKTQRQRPLLLHHGGWADEWTHDGEHCWCHPERFEANR